MLDTLGKLVSTLSMSKPITPRVSPNRAKIRELLDTHRWTQHTLAEQIGMNPTLLSKQLKGHRDMELGTLIQIAMTLKVPWQDLVAEECHACRRPLGLAV